MVPWTQVFQKQPQIGSAAARGCFIRAPGPWITVGPLTWSVLDQREDAEGLDPVDAPQLLQLYDHHTLQNLGLQLLQQLTGSKQRPCDTRDIAALASEAKGHPDPGPGPGDQPGLQDASRRFCLIHQSL